MKQINSIIITASILSILLALAGCGTRTLTESTISDQTSESKIQTSDLTSGSTVQVSDLTSETKVQVSNQSSEPKVQVSDQTSEPKVQISNKTSEPKVQVSDQTSKPKVQVSDQTSEPKVKVSNKTSESNVQVSDQTSKPKIQISNKTSEPKVQVSEQTSEPKVQISNKTSEPNVQVSDQTSEPEIQVSNQTSEPEIQVSDQTSETTESIIAYGLCNSDCIVTTSEESFDLYRGQNVSIIKIENNIITIQWYKTTAKVPSECINIYPHTYVPDFSKGQWPGTINDNAVNETQILAYGICKSNCIVNSGNESYELYKGQQICILSYEGEKILISWYDSNAKVSKDFIQVFPETYVPDFSKGQWVGVITK